MHEGDTMPKEWTDPAAVFDSLSKFAKALWISARKEGVVSERKRILEGLVEAEVLPLNTLAAHRKPTHGHCCTCQICGHAHDECVCETNAILRIVNPDVEESR